MPKWYIAKLAGVCTILVDIPAQGLNLEILKAQARRYFSNTETQPTFEKSKNSLN